MNNSYVPVKAEIIEVIQETSSDVDIKTFKIKLVDDEKMDFCQASLWNCPYQE